VAKAELGTKRICPETGRKFYDLGKTPVVSPYTGKVVPIVAPPQSRARPEPAQPAPVARPAPAPEPEAIVPETADAEFVSLEDAEAEQQGKKPAAEGAAMHLVTHAGEQYPMIGASAVISGTMAGAMRFAFQQGGPLSFRRNGDATDYRVPAIPLTGVLRDFRVLAFLAVWFGINLLFGLGSLPFAGSGQVVAWQAHIGGFLAGLLLFSWFDPEPDFERFDDLDATQH